MTSPAAHGLSQARANIPGCPIAHMVLVAYQAALSTWACFQLEPSKFEIAPWALADPTTSLAFRLLDSASIALQLSEATFFYYQQVRCHEFAKYLSWDPESAVCTCWISSISAAPVPVVLRQTWQIRQRWKALRVSPRTQLGTTAKTVLAKSQIIHAGSPHFGPLLSTRSVTVIPWGEGERCNRMRLSCLYILCIYTFKWCVWQFTSTLAFYICTLLWVDKLAI